MNTEQKYRVVGKSGPGVDWHVGMIVRSISDRIVRAIQLIAGDVARCGTSPNETDWTIVRSASWDGGRYEILEAISPPQAGRCTDILCGTLRAGAVWYCGSRCRDEVEGSADAKASPPPQATAKGQSWCGLPYRSPNVPTRWTGPDQMPFGIPPRGDGPNGEKALDMSAYCTQACLDRAKATAGTVAWGGLNAKHVCSYLECKGAPVAGSNYCKAHTQCDRTRQMPPYCKLVCQLKLGHSGDHVWLDSPIGVPVVPCRHGATSACTTCEVATKVAERAKPPVAWVPELLDGDIPDATTRAGLRFQVRTPELDGTRLGR